MLQYHKKYKRASILFVLQPRAEYKKARKGATASPLTPKPAKMPSSKIKKPPQLIGRFFSFFARSFLPKIARPHAKKN